MQQLHQGGSVCLLLAPGLQLFLSISVAGGQLGMAWAIINIGKDEYHGICRAGIRLSFCDTSRSRIKNLM
jgi:hypothetical protein